MYAIAFDLKIDDLKKEYGEPYNKAYDEIRIELEKLGFRWVQGSIYISDNTQNSLVTVYNAINKLSKITWFKKVYEILELLKLKIGQILQVS